MLACSVHDDLAAMVQRQRSTASLRQVPAATLDLVPGTHCDEAADGCFGTIRCHPSRILQAFTKERA